MVARLARDREFTTGHPAKILDSIKYARRIQRALITSEYYINKELRKWI
jgi:hypothetical protein